jgi:uncharacterized membrane protein (DUF106 family)
MDKYEELKNKSDKKMEELQTKTDEYYEWKTESDKAMEELRKESAERAVKRWELVRKIEKREKIVDVIWHISIWSWIFIWWFIWNTISSTRHINFFLSILVFTVVCFSVGYIMMLFSVWVRSKVGRTVK